MQGFQRFAVLVIAAAAVIVGTAGCGPSAGRSGGASGSTTTSSAAGPASVSHPNATSTTSTTATITATATATATAMITMEASDAPPPTSTAEATRTAPAGQAAATVRDIRTAQHATYDRLVIDLTGPIPGYQASYVNTLVYDASGAPVPLHGAAYLRLTLKPAATHDPTTGKDTFTGARLVPTTGLPALRGYALTGDFEAVVSVGTAINRPNAPFRVITLTDPNRIVVDIAH